MVKKALNRFICILLIIGKKTGENVVTIMGMQG
jgi:hypothetical protein